ncbi:MAG TPA: hypothetical protein VGU69_10495 [Rhizomicrobium sp.]|nr:hypothetical protein [Rhizomicrobium sp.]
MSKTQPLLYGWTCYLGAWIFMGVFVLPLSSALAGAVGTTAAGGVYYGISLALGYALLLVRRDVVDQLHMDGMESALGPLLRLILWTLAWIIVMPVSLTLIGLRAARL